jgi:hypothetical protein
VTHYVRPPNFQHASFSISAAHAVCRQAETKVKERLRRATTLTENKNQEKHLADVRILGYLLSEGTDAAKAHIAKSILSLGAREQGQNQITTRQLEDDQADQIIELGEFFFAYFIRTCKSICQLAAHEFSDFSFKCS